MSTEIVVAGIALCAAVASALISYLSQRTAWNAQLGVQGLQQRVVAEQTLKAYRDPLMRAAFDLQSRLWNIGGNLFFQVFYEQGDETEREYAISNTMFVVAEYLGWCEIIRREVHFIDLGDDDQSRLVSLDEEIRKCFMSNGYPERSLRLFAGEQRAIGELMMIGADKQRQCMGYAEFCEKLDSPAFARWFTPLRQNIEAMTTAREPSERLVELQNLLVDLLGILDPHYRRFSQSWRTKLEFVPML